MRVLDGPLPGTLVLEPEPRHDERGFFVRTLDTAVLAAAGVPGPFVQENQSRSAFATLRGLHLRAGPGEGKLVRCARGRVFDVLVDLRPSSAAFGRWASLVLDDVDHRHVYLPPGVAHGFQVLSEVADICYHHDAPYVAQEEAAVAWDDPALGVAWPLPPRNLSDRDQGAPSLEAVLPALRGWFPGGPS